MTCKSSTFVTLIHTVKIGTTAKWQWRSFSFVSVRGNTHRGIEKTLALGEVSFEVLIADRVAHP